MNLEGYVELDEAARQMNLTTSQVMRLVSRRALRAVRIVDEVLVQPAILTGSMR